MKILVSGSKDSDNFKKVIAHLKKVGHNVYEDTKIPKTGDASERALKELERNVKNADIVITDTTKHDFKAGYVISKALSEKKVVIALEEETGEEKDENLNPFLYHNKAKNLLIRSFEAKNLTQVVDEALEDGKKRLDTKFILIISPEIDRYLDWASTSKRMHKAQLVRNAIEAQLEKDREYKAYLEEK